jgi:beta-galactosidase
LQASLPSGANPGPASKRGPRAPATRTTTLLDAGWRFIRDEVPGAAAAEFEDNAWDSVTLPHTFNGADGDDGGTYYRGPAWYRRALTLDRIPAGRRLWIQFDGAALVADLWVNGVHLGRHEGGYATFRFDVTDALKPGRNSIAVRVDNSKAPNVTPLGGDFTIFGGLYRHVRLIEVPDVHIDLGDHGGPGVYLATQKLDQAHATLSARILLRNDGSHRARVPVKITVADMQGETAASSTKLVEMEGRQSVSIAIPMVIARPHLWNGRADPYLYTVTAELNGDTVSVPLGLRTIRIDPEQGLVLNGHPYPIHGVNLFHPGRPGRGLAVTDTEIDADVDQVAELGATGVRLVHFQHPQEIYDQADRRGLLLWTEIGLNGVIDPGPAFAANASEQMRELIRQNYNHPSVMLWGLGNEVYATTPDVTRVLRTVQSIAHEEDATRPTVYAHCCQPDDNEKAGISDVIGFNRYFGWYPGQTGSIGAWADGFHAQYPMRAFAVSEYGAGASIRHQQLPPPAQNVPDSGWHPEQAQTQYHVDNWRQLATRPYLFGTYVWVAFDLASDGRHEGDRPGINDKGLVTYDRSTRKDAYFWYQANWSSTPMIHMTDRRLDRRSEAAVAIRAFTNAPEATLWVNGRLIGLATAKDHEVRWPAVPLTMGTNLFSVTAGSASDSMRLTRVAASAAGASDIPEVVASKVENAPASKPPGQ